MKNQRQAVFFLCKSKVLDMTLGKIERGIVVRVWSRGWM